MYNVSLYSNNHNYSSSFYKQFYSPKKNHLFQYQKNYKLVQMNAAESSQQEDEKPVNQELNIKVKDQRGTAICFKMKRTIKLKKLMQTYCARNGYPQNSVRFLYEGEEIRETDTPEGLKMEDGDQIETMVAQRGGGF